MRTQSWRSSQQRNMRQLSRRSVFVFIFLIVATGCMRTIEPQQLPVETETPTQQPSYTIAPSITPEPSATETVIPEPSSTFTTVPTATIPSTSTATQVPELAVMPDGFTVWCNPLDYALRYQPGPEIPKQARTMMVVDGQLQVYVPAEFCTLVYRMNLPVSKELKARLYDGNRDPFLVTAVTSVEGQPDVGFVEITHPYVVNPPFWSVNYRIELVDSEDMVLHSAQVNFARPLPERCTFGGWPDPVTMYCPTTDPWEVEPKPGVIYPYPTLTPSPD